MRPVGGVLGEGCYAVPPQPACAIGIPCPWLFGPLPRTVARPNLHGACPRPPPPTRAAPLLFLRGVQSINHLMSHVAGMLAAEPDKLIGGRDRGSAALSTMLHYCHHICSLLHVPADQAGRCVVLQGHTVPRMFQQVAAPSVPRRRGVVPKQLLRNRACVGIRTSRAPIDRASQPHAWGGTL